MEKLNSENHYKEIDYLKGLAIILMILGHSIAGRNLGMENSGICKIFYDFIYSFHMSLFFFASGFLYRYYDNYFNYITKKVKRILMPYVIFCIAIILVRMMLPGFTVEEASTKEMLLSILLYGGTLWFLYVLFLIFLIFPLLDKITYGWRRGGGITVLLVLIVLECILPPIELFELSDLIFYLIPFIIGRMFRLNNYYDKLKNIDHRHIYIICGILFHIVLFIACLNLDIDWLKRAISIIISVVGCFWVFLLIQTIKCNKVKYYLTEFGNYSLQIYLFNGYFIAAIRILMKVLGIHNIYILIILYFVVGLIVNYWFCKLILKNKVFALLCGGIIKHDSKV